ncbi:MAG: 50S ribosomal protein L5 [Candidatus Omnitrophota bacterium]|mgnify:CR=1 FL=1|nr:MAG: 50S ribosomal protein L5 [Candidatus Omnitrophota bacterium]
MRDEIMRNIDRVVVNVGVGTFRKNAGFEDKILPYISDTIAVITGQRPAPVPAKASIAEFKVRKGDIVGLKATLRGRRMSDFLMKLVNVVLPRLRDFRGMPLTAVDSTGNLNVGLGTQAVFPEVDMDKSVVEFGLQVTAVAKHKDRDKMIEIYRKLGVPLQM